MKLFWILEPFPAHKITWTLVRANSKEEALGILNMPATTLNGVHETSPEGKPQVMFTAGWEKKWLKKASRMLYVLLIERDGCHPHILGISDSIDNAIKLAKKFMSETEGRWDNNGKPYFESEEFWTNNKLDMSLNIVERSLGDLYKNMG